MRQFAALIIRFYVSFSLCITLLANSPCWAENSSLAFKGSVEGQLFALQGSNTVGAHLAPQWVKAYLEAKGLSGVIIEPLPKANEYRISGRNGARIAYVDVHAHGSSTGFIGLGSETAQIAMASRAIKAQEAKALSRLGDLFSSESEHVVAIDGLAIIVNPKNSISEMTISQAQGVFSGKITNWSALGGPNRVISVYARDDNSGTFDTFKSLVLQDKRILTPRARRFESNDDLSNRVSSDIGGIGFVGLASVQNAKALAIADTNTAALKPKAISVATEDYPLSRRLFLYTEQKPTNPYVKEFIAFSQSIKGQNIVEDVGFVSQNPKSIQMQTTEGPEPYQLLAKAAQRLSVNIRFVEGRANLDNKALQDVKRLAHYLRQKSTFGAEQSFVQLVGFSNVESSEKRAQVLSRLRATAVKTALYQYGVKSESVIGFGDNMPVANMRGSAAIKNERVEVWVFDSEQLSNVNELKEALLTQSFKIENKLSQSQP